MDAGMVRLVEFRGKARGDTIKGIYQRLLHSHTHTGVKFIAWNIDQARHKALIMIDTAK